MRLVAIEDGNVGEAVAILARGFPGRPVSFWRASLERLSAYRRASAGPPIGRLMKVEGKPVGVILTIASKHRAGGREQEVVNLSSWYVDEQYRWLAPGMLERIVADDSVVFTDLSPSPQAARINERLGFRTAAEGMRLYFLPWTAIGLPAAGRMIRLEHLPAGALNTAEHELLTHHQELGCIAAALHVGKTYYAFLFHPSRRRGLPAADLLYAPSRRIVSEHRVAIARHLLSLGMLFLIIHGDKARTSTHGGFLWNRSASVQVKGNWEPDRIDHTYSELVFLKAPLKKEEWQPMLSAGVDLAHAETESILYEYLAKRFPQVATWSGDTSLLNSGIVDSLGVLELMTFVSERFGIPLEDGDFDPAHLATPGHLVRFILSRRQRN